MYEENGGNQKPGVQRRSNDRVNKVHVTAEPLMMRGANGG